MSDNATYLALRILTVIDKGTGVRPVAQATRDLCSLRDCRVTIVGVGKSARAPKRAGLASAVQDALTILGDAPLAVETQLVASQPAVALTTCANQEPPDLIVAAAPVAGEELRLSAGLAGPVVKHARCPVLLMRPSYGGLRRVLLAVDYSPNSQAALEALTRFPLPRDVRVWTMHVLRPTLPNELTGEVAARARFEAAEGRALIARVNDALLARGLEAVPVVSRGAAAAQINAYAAAQAIDLVVLGTHGYGRLRGWLEDSVSQRFVREGTCSVLVVPNGTRMHSAARQRSTD